MRPGRPGLQGGSYRQTVVLPRPLGAELRQIAERAGATVGDLCRDALSEWVIRATGRDPSIRLLLEPLARVEVGKEENFGDHFDKLRAIVAEAEHTPAGSERWPDLPELKARARTILERLRQEQASLHDLRFAEMHIEEIDHCIQGRRELASNRLRAAGRGIVCPNDACESTPIALVPGEPSACTVCGFKPPTPKPSNWKENVTVNEICRAPTCTRTADYEVVLYDVYAYMEDEPVFFQQDYTCPYLCAQHVAQNENEAKGQRSPRGHVSYPFTNRHGAQGFNIYRPLGGTPEPISLPSLPTDLDRVKSFIPKIQRLVREGEQLSRAADALGRPTNHDGEAFASWWTRTVDTASQLGRQPEQGMQDAGAQIGKALERVAQGTAIILPAQVDHAVRLLLKLVDHLWSMAGVPQLPRGIKYRGLRPG